MRSQEVKAELRRANARPPSRGRLGLHSRGRLGLHSRGSHEQVPTLAELVVAVARLIGAEGDDTSANGADGDDVPEVEGDDVGGDKVDFVGRVEAGHGRGASLAEIAGVGAGDEL